MGFDTLKLAFGLVLTYVATVLVGTFLLGWSDGAVGIVGLSLVVLVRLFWPFGGRDQEDDGGGDERPEWAAQR